MINSPNESLKTCIAACQWSSAAITVHIGRVRNMKNRLLQNGSTKVSMHSSDCNQMKTKTIGNATLWLKCYRNSLFASYSSRSQME